MFLECMEAEFLGDHVGDHAIEMPPLSTSKFSDALVLPLASQPLALCGGHVALGCVP